ncbi:hypothetical protein H4F33_20205 [Pectobacterium brasiliense]|uniref:Uncharacterized protein n=1 Tax=Pectobacterium brasiliense TaxID=180957 RepID=A0AAE2WDN3_9GAMM|nr:hypothetical protein [Pectobacterium brasiliense]MBA0219774.1 hypothetical protein [Pectobacterium brasiliense]MBN3051494.1 hypothetical protein [Pectobacterium brasiliense]MBN3074381.1 hypothetical protein [Pectobacterium brasiliense]MBN3171629.1 hypothetical protein [Pectobacterium brasiliense]
MLTLGLNKALRNRICAADERVRGELCFPYLEPEAISNPFDLVFVAVTTPSFNLTLFVVY